MNASEIRPENRHDQWNSILCRLHPSQKTLRIQDIMCVRDHKQRSMMSLAEEILERILMLDAEGRDQCNALKSTEEAQTENVFSIDSAFAEGAQSPKGFHPLDVMLTAFIKCHLLLRQKLLQKMFLCKLAVPFFYYEFTKRKYEMCLWALSTITFETKDAEISADIHPMPIVTFLRFGRPAFSKSNLLNHILSAKAYPTFQNIECAHYGGDRMVSDGLVEASWFIPSKHDQRFEITLFLNLRGDACIHERQFDFVCSISSVVVFVVQLEDLQLKNIHTRVTQLHQKQPKVVALFTGVVFAEDKRSSYIQNYKEILGEKVDSAQVITEYITAKPRGKKAIVSDVSTALSKSLNSGRKLTCIRDFSKEDSQITVDEEEKDCEIGMMLADEVVSALQMISKDLKKLEILPLQCEPWQEWSKLLREKSSTKQKDGEEQNTTGKMVDIWKRMIAWREKQWNLSSSFNPGIQKFGEVLLEKGMSGDVIFFFMQWLQIHLSRISKVSEQRTKCIMLWASLRKAKASQDEEDRKGLQQEVEAAEKMLDNVSFGIQHLLREMAQWYEAFVSLQKQPIHSEDISKLSKVAARLLIDGMPLELLDGDVASVPLSWLTAVFEDLKDIIGDKKLFVLSVLGVQSSGKSTMLNTMFGLQLSVSAGRCTRGVFAQLVPVMKDSSLPFDYILVIDTEGLRAPEITDDKYTQDNELATFAIGLGQITIINIMGETLAEVKDVLQIVVHAFLRMKIVRKSMALEHNCIFVHQNVSAVDAKGKMALTHQRLDEELNKMTLEAAQFENCPDIKSFQDVIKFDPKNYVRFMTNLWSGDPPMAPVNDGYSKGIIDIKEHLLFEIAGMMNHDLFLSTSNTCINIKDLWDGIISDDFVFSFRNNLELKSYQALHVTYTTITWNMEKEISNWVKNYSEKEFALCEEENEVEKRCDEILCNFYEKFETFYTVYREQLTQFFDKGELRSIFSQWKKQFFDQFDDKAKRLKESEKVEVTNLSADHIKRIHQKKIEGQLSTGTIMEMAYKHALNFAGKPTEKNIKRLFAKAKRTFIYDKEPEEKTCKEPFDQTATALLKKRYPEHRSLLYGIIGDTFIPGDKQTLKDCLIGSGITDKDYTEEKGRWYVPKMLQQNKNPTVMYSKVAQTCQGILQSVELYINEISSTEQRFKKEHFVETLERVHESFIDYNKNESKKRGFTLTNDIHMKLQIFSFRHAIFMAGRMEKVFEEIHGHSAKLKEIEDSAWHLYYNILSKAAEDVVAADLLVDTLKTPIFSAIMKLFCEHTVNMVVGRLEQKSCLIENVLRSLATKGDFVTFQSYLKDPKEFSSSWIFEYTTDLHMEKNIDGKPICFDFVRKQYENFSKRILGSIEKAFADTDRKTDMKNMQWISVFCYEVSGTLNVPMYELRNFQTQKINDPQNFTNRVKSRIEEYECSILENILNEQKTNVNWIGDPPYSQIMQKLWGCPSLCPLCNEPCIFDDPQHIHTRGHTCFEHRPGGVIGECDTEERRLSTESCNNRIAASQYLLCGKWSTECRKKGSFPCRNWMDRPQKHNLRYYKEYIPEWEIAPTHDPPTLWLQCMKKFCSQLMEFYPGTQPPNNLHSWYTKKRDSTLKFH